MKMIWIWLAAVVFLPVAAWSAGKRETHLAMDQLPPAVKATIEQESAGARVEEVEKEREGGKTYYEAEIVKDGTTSYIHVGEDGKVLKRETAAQERKAEGREHEEKGEHHRK